MQILRVPSRQVGTLNMRLFKENYEIKKYKIKLSLEEDELIY